MQTIGTNQLGNELDNVIDELDAEDLSVILEKWRLRKKEKW